MHSFSKIVFSLAMSTLIITGCALDIPVPQINIPPGTVKVTIDPNELQEQINQLQGNQLVCVAGLPASAGGVVSSGVSSPIEVSATGGVGPYEILNTAIAFSSQTVVARTYTNTGSSNIMLVDTVSVKDSLGLVTQCNFIVTVRPATNPSSLACNLGSSVSTAQVNENINLLTTASGGVGPYSFSNLTLASGGSVVSALAPISATQASATVKFSSSGSKTNNVRVTDSTANFVVCSSTVSIQSQASVSLVATPSVSVPVGSSIVLSAVAQNFSPAANFVFSTTESGISLVPNGSSVTVSVANGVAHPSFSVQVVASNGSQSATSSISLSFTQSSSPLVCTLSHPSGTYKVGDTINFSVNATSGEALTISTFVVSSDATIVTSSNATRGVRYANPGTKYIYALAKSASTNQWCNEGQYVTDTVEVANSGGGGTTPLACSAYTNYNPSYLNEYFYAYGILTGGNPNNRWVESVRVLRSGSVVTNYTGYWYDRYTAVLAITNSTSFNPRTTYQVELTSKDSLGNTATCSTNHIVR